MKEQRHERDHTGDMNKDMEFWSTWRMCGKFWCHLTC